MHIAQILEDIRKSALSEQEKGRRFERLVQAWFRADPLYAEELDKVWLWEQFPAREQFGSHDLGIGLVARTKLGEYWVIQCKFYAENTPIDKAAVDSFISNSSRTITDPIAGNEKAFFAQMGRQHCFDLIICDAAHRTTDIIKSSEGQSNFTKAHKNEFIRAQKRLYMTATPRLYEEGRNKLAGAVGAWEKAQNEIRDKHDKAEFQALFKLLSKID